MDTIYKDIAKRTNGDIYIGVVGPVRTGKSTFIKRFMDVMVMPAIRDVHQRERTRDELPQSAAGRTIMTTEPKFVPNEAIGISFQDGGRCRVRLIDCVGYVIDGAMGTQEDERPRMVHTPWSTEEIPFEKAAEIGTDKVITEHSTIGFFITTDGSISDFPREAYIEAEERVGAALQQINKPFIIIVNSLHPKDEETRSLAQSLSQKYGVGCVCADCAHLSAEDISEILKKVLYEFPITQIGIDLPQWIDGLPHSHYVKNALFDSIRASVGKIRRLCQAPSMAAQLSENEYVKTAVVSSIAPEDGSVLISVTAKEGLFFRILSEQSGFCIENEEALLSLLRDLSEMNKEYERIKYALMSVRETGYGVVTPSIDELTLEEPEIIKQGGRYGVRLRASAPSIHMMRADIEASVSPLVGSEQQSEDLVNYLLQDFENDPTKIWESNIFGKSLHELINESLAAKLSHMPQESRYKLRETLERIINEGSGGLICIIL